MDPVSVGLLAALANGSGGEIGRQAWATLSALVRRPFRRGRQDTQGAPVVSSGEAELVELERAPADSGRAQALSTALAVRVGVDADFRTNLEQWHEQARLVRTGDGEVHNEISGGTFNGGPIQQGRDFSGISFTMPHPPPASPGAPSAQD